MMSTSGAKDKNFAGDPIPSKCAVIEVRVGELKQLFDAIDRSNKSQVYVALHLDAKYTRITDNPERPE
jgi:hypothetical protein